MKQKQASQVIGQAFRNLIKFSIFKFNTKTFQLNSQHELNEIVQKVK